MKIYVFTEYYLHLTKFQIKLPELMKKFLITTHPKNMNYISFDRVSSVLFKKVVLTIFGDMISEISIVKINVIKRIKILKFDENSRFYKMLLEFD